MSATFPLTGHIDPPSSTKLTTTNQTDVFTADAAFTQKVIAIWIANEDTSNDIKVTLHWNDGSTDYAFFVGSIPSEDTLVLDTPLRLSSQINTEKIKATAATANQITVTIITAADLSQQGPGA